MLAPVTFLLALSICERADVCPGSVISIRQDAETQTYFLEGSRATPALNAQIIDYGRLDLDQDGVAEMMIIDDRESAFGSVTAVFYDISLGAPYMAFQCQASTREAVETECLDWYQSLTAQRAIQGADIIYSGTRQDGELDWETQHLTIPNWTASIALTIANMNVELHRERHANSGSAETLAGLEAALDLRELRALQFSIAD